MKNKVYILLLLFILFSTNQASEDEWYPFVIPEKLDQNSPVNIGKLVLDAPAGKHGFVKVKDGHFIFEDGSRAKFWGTNLCFNACFPDKNHAEIIASRIAFFGFNAVRLHHMDSYFEPKGIFEDVSPDNKDSQMKKTGVLSKKQLDKLDYLIYQLKLHGIYIDINLLVSRHFTEADGVKEAGKFRMAAKPISMYDTGLISLQKKYAKDLFTHFNPYTKLRYNEEPAIALIEITNENSVVRFWQENNLNGAFLGIRKKSIPDYYVEDLDKRWNLWLKEKYGSTENVEKAWAGIPVVSNKNYNIFDTSKWTIEQHNDVSAVINTINKESTIIVNKISNIPWHIQYKINNLHLIKNKKYMLKFTAKANKKLKISIISQQNFKPGTNLGLSENIELSNVFQTIEILFSPKEDCENAKLSFIIGYATATINVKDITFIEQEHLEISEKEISSGFNFIRPLYKFKMIYSSKRIDDLQSFYDNLEIKYFNEMIDFLKNDLDIKVPITGSQHSSISVQKSCDFIDKHVYWDHPNFPNIPWDRNDFKIHNSSIMLNKKLGIMDWLDQNSKIIKSNLKPFTITEWNFCYPNQYAYEGPLLMSSKAIENNLDVLFQFAFSNGWKSNPIFDSIDKHFDIIPNPQQLILVSISSLLFHKSKDLAIDMENNILTIKSDIIQGVEGFIKNKNFNFDCFSIEAKQNGSIFVFSTDNKPMKESARLIIVVVSEVKNNNSGWNSDGKFIWGTSPVFLKKIDITIKFNSKKHYKIYELNTDGKRGNEIKKNENNYFSNLNSKTLWFEIIN